MKCNICGGEIPAGQNTCKYCGNVVSMPEKKQSTSIPRNIEMPPRKPAGNSTSVDAKIYQQNKEQGGYCIKCGRPLDGVTHKCIVCDAAQVSKRAYVNEEFKNREMNIMAQKKKKKKKNNTIRNTVLAILGMIVLFSVAVYGALKLSDMWGIGGANDDSSSSVTVTDKPRVTADPNWEAEVKDDDDKKEKSTPEPTEIPTMAPARTPEPVETGDPVELRGGEYLYPSDTHLISEDELKELTREEIKRIYWEIYARHGYTFDDELADYFENNHSWYMPTTSDATKVEAKFNSIEKRNKSTIEKYQKDMGWRK